MRLLQITDLHLSSRRDTPAAAALRWAVDQARRLRPDLVAVTGDITTFGSEGAALQFLEALAGLGVPWVFTPGNAERRAPGALRVLRAVAAKKSLEAEGVRFLLPDTSTGGIPPSEREWLRARAQDGRPLVILTHYPVDTLDADSRRWIESWLAAHRVELYLAGHRHFSRSRSVGGRPEVIARGLDPDKAFGGPPGISLFEKGAAGRWSERALPWPRAHALLPAETAHSPVGWSIHGDPVESVRQTREFGLNVLELRPRDSEYRLARLVAELDSLRRERPVYLSWHLPALRWNEERAAIEGSEAVARQLEQGRACEVDAYTLHVPQVAAARMGAGDGSASGVRDLFLAECDRLFAAAVSEGITLSIENVHNPPGTPRHRRHRKFATEIGEYLGWIDSVAALFAPGPGRVGAHLDLGHARNNGELGNVQPLGDWYARVGRRISGYHIHQVRPDEHTGKLTNHREIRSIYDRTISYAGFFHAWSCGLINRAPLFVEVRDAEERRRTARLLKDLFERPDSHGD